MSDIKQPQESRRHRERPNVLFLLTDQHSPRIAGFAGDEVAQTPHLDRLAAKSIQFDAAICASPVCTSSRMCMLTGKEVHRAAAWNNHWVIFPEHVTWPAHFAAHGYRTCLVGKMHFGGRDQMQGFQHRPYGDLRHGLGHQPDPIDLFPAYAGPLGAGIPRVCLNIRLPCSVSALPLIESDGPPCGPCPISSERLSDWLHKPTHDTLFCPGRDSKNTAVLTGM